MSIKLNIFFNKYNNTQPISPTMLNVIYLGGKGCQKMYNIIHKKTNITNEPKNKWEHILNEEVPLEDIQKAFLITQRSPNCIYSRYVQFKILHNRLNTRQLLCKINILSTHECLYCKNQIDSTVHALLECPVKANLWGQVELWLRTHLEQNINIFDKEKVFGITENNQYTFLIKMFIIITKFTIYQRRPECLKISINDVLRSI